MKPVKNHPSRLTRFVLSLALGLGLAAAFNWLNPGAGADGVVTIGPRNLLAVSQRTPLGQQFSNGQILANIGSETLLSVDGQNWQPAAPGYQGGAWQLTTLGERNRLLAFSYNALNWNGSGSRYESTFTVYASPTGAPLLTRQFFVYGLPFDPAGDTLAVYPGMVARHNGSLYMTIWRYYVQSEVWQGQTVSNARLISSYLVKSVSPNYLREFVFVSEIASRETAPAIPNSDLPLYYAAEPFIASVSANRIVAVMRTSADDDDATRPLDPNSIFATSSFTFSDRAGDFAGADAVAGVWQPPLDPARYYQGDAAQPGILLAVSDDSGQTWTRQLLPVGGIAPTLAYDPTADVLMLATGGVTYPRRGHAILYSSDQGDTWSGAAYLPDAGEGRTSGTTTLLNVQPGQFLLLYDLLPLYVQIDGVEDSSSYNGYSRLITVSSP